MSFLKEKVIYEGLTFDDVLLVPAYSEVLPRDVDISTRFSRNIQIKVSHHFAAMDTVTESAAGHCHGKGRRDRCYPQKHAYTNAG